MKTMKNLICPAFALFAFACFALRPAARAVSPPPDGGYPGQNTAEGDSALLSVNTATGISNTAVGWSALKTDTSGQNNTAIGSAALFYNTGSNNTATGLAALFNNTTAGSNTADGALALYHNTAGESNTALGFEALFNNLGTLTGVQGSFNTAVGYQALLNNVAGINNTAVGYLAGIGNVNGSGNIFIGVRQGPVTSAEIGHTYIGNIDITSLPFGGSIDLVTIDLTSGLLGHDSSSRRYKEEIRPMDKASEALYRLKPVTYRLKKEVNEHQSRAFGLIAEDVAEVNSDLIVRDAQGQAEGVHYEMVNAMLLNEFLKDHRKVERLEKQVEALTAGLQTVSAQLELNKPASQTVKNND